jgi:hypothetical protein
MKQQVMIEIDQNDQYVEHVSICVFNSTIFNVKKKEEKEKLKEKNEESNKLPSSLSSMYMYA